MDLRVSIFLFVSLSFFLLGLSRTSAIDSTVFRTSFAWGHGSLAGMNVIGAIILSGMTELDFWKVMLITVALVTGMLDMVSYHTLLSRMIRSFIHPKKKD